MTTQGSEEKAIAEMKEHETMTDEERKIDRLQKEKRDWMERNGIEVDPMGDDDPNGSDTSGGELDTLRENYSLDTLRNDRELQSEIDTLEQRISALEGRCPNHVDTLRAEKTALETLQGSTVKSWMTVRQKVGD
jgi:hypothetical protein